MKLDGKLRIGPHPVKVISIVMGSLLGDAYGERRCYQIKDGLILGNTRFTFKQGGRNVQYILWNWKILSTYGYCSSKKPVLRKTIGIGNKIYFNIKFHTWTYSSFNEIYENFYKEGIKVVPDNEFLDKYLTPLALATWIMDVGSNEKKAGLLIHTNSFTYKDIERLCDYLTKRYDLSAKPGLKNKVKAQWLIYIPKRKIPVLSKLIKDYLSPDILRKISDS